jgi:hypothetical protein
MSQLDAVNSLDLSAWQAENLRLTAFINPAERIDPSTWWECLVGEAPETKLQKPKTGEQEEKGRFKKGYLALQVQPTRIDWRFSSVLEQEKLLEAFPTLGSFPEALRSFVELMTKWLKMCPPIDRLAFGALLVLPVEDKRTGYRQLSALLPLEVDAEGSSDFTYSINRPRPSKSGIPNLKINRLSKWAFVVLRLAAVSVGRHVGHAPYDGPSACRLELDINTAAEFEGELPQEHILRIFDELVDLGQEIASKGDIP